MATIAIAQLANTIAEILAHKEEYPNVCQEGACGVGADPFASTGNSASRR